MRLLRRRKYLSVPEKESKNEKDQTHKPHIPDGMWQKCPDCKQTVLSADLSETKICPQCSYHFRISPKQRIQLICDHGQLEEELFYQDEMTNPIDFPDYEAKKRSNQERTGYDEAVTCGLAKIKGQPLALGIMNPFFMMGSMGSIVGEKITRLFEYAKEHALPVLLFTASGGARMQEGIISLMQMTKISIAVERHSQAGLFYLTVLTDPTTGGVTASFAMQGDIIIAEPGATIGFAGKRVIEQTIHQKIEEGFQTAEHQLEHGFVDRIVPRQQLRDEIADLFLLNSREGDIHDY
ncbi:acetyl-CoA carboxylase, carboxyltransferase subunit beta [Aerococcus urinae]|uniref:acetyl-CoA carboxylase, carboxyltransferase subunit beta n=1 Tax=Aerococcus urinae TaxID=1376 RepID=UPI0018A73436|nr:acetyl-CoA carboxylase, carboxyltransferase subunit beta [Aerococcus urinae]